MRRARSFFPAAALAAMAMALAATGGCVAPIRESGFTLDSRSLRPARGLDFSVTIDETAIVSGLLEGATTPSVIALRRVGWATGHEVRSPQTALVLEKDIETEFYYAALAHYPAPTVVTTSSDLAALLRVSDSVWLVEIAVTDLDPGIGVLRWLIGYYLGAAEAQVEFRLREAHTNRLVACFVTRREHPGDAKMGLNIKAMSARDTLARLSAPIAKDAVELMARILACDVDLFEPIPARALEEGTAMSGSSMSGSS